MRRRCQKRNDTDTYPEGPDEDDGIAGLNACAIPCGCIACPFGAIAMPFTAAPLNPLAPDIMKLPFWWKPPPFIGIGPPGWNIEVAIAGPQGPGAYDVLALWHSVPDATATDDVVEVEGADEDAVALLKR